MTVGRRGTVGVEVALGTAVELDSCEWVFGGLGGLQCTREWLQQLMHYLKANNGMSGMCAEANLHAFWSS